MMSGCRMWIYFNCHCEEQRDVAIQADECTQPTFPLEWKMSLRSVATADRQPRDDKVFQSKISHRQSHHSIVNSSTATSIASPSSLEKVASMLKVG